MKAKLYINSEESTIKVEGSANDVLQLLVEASVKILVGYFPHSFAERMAWISGLFYGTISTMNKEDDDED